MENEKENKKKKYVFFIIPLLLLIAIPIFFLNKSVVAVAETEAEAEDNSPRIYVSDVSADAGGEVYVSVNVANNPGFAGIVLDFEYDESVLTPLEVLQGSLVDQGGLFASNLNDSGVIKTTWFDVTEIEENGELFAVKFRVSAAGKGTESPITLSYSNGNISNLAYEDVDFTLGHANVTIR